MGQMGVEIERKYLVTDDRWRQAVSRVRHVRQGYLSKAGAVAVRVRCVDNEHAFLTVKSAKQGIRRQEFEYPIPVREAEELMLLCEGCVIEKQRYDLQYAGMTWEIDVFLGANEGLVIAEVELAREDQEIEIPPWASSEVTDDERYYNAGLSKHPYCTW
jgi:adenylate cyclase